MLIAKDGGQHSCRLVLTLLGDIDIDIGEMIMRMCACIEAVDRSDGKGIIRFEI